MSEEELLVELLTAMVVAFRERFPECEVQAFNTDIQPSPENKPWMEISIDSWDPAGAFSKNRYAYAIAVDFELRITDKNRNQENWNVSTAIRVLALRANSLIRNNRWGLSFVSVPEKNIRASDDRLDERIRREEQWVVRWTQTVGVGEIEPIMEGYQ